MSEVVRFNKKDIVSAAGGQLTAVDNTAGGKNLNSVRPAGANFLRVRVEKNGSTTNTVVVRFFSDGYGFDGTGVPTSTKGIPVANLDILTFSADEIPNLIFIGTDANSQTLWLTWYTV